MSQKKIRKGDIVRIRHNTSCHQFPENTLGVVTQTFPLWDDEPTSFEVTTREDFWRVNIEDITLFKRNPNPDEDDL